MKDDKVLDMAQWSKFMEELVCFDVKLPKRRRPKSYYLILLDDDEVGISMFDCEHWDYAMSVMNMIKRKRKR